MRRSIVLVSEGPHAVACLAAVKLRGAHPSALHVVLS